MKERIRDSLWARLPKEKINMQLPNRVLGRPLGILIALGGMFRKSYLTFHKIDRRFLVEERIQDSLWARLPKDRINVPLPNRILERPLGVLTTLGGMFRKGYLTFHKIGGRFLVEERIEDSLWARLPKERINVSLPNRVLESPLGILITLGGMFRKSYRILQQ